jgi:hypothetical protein
MSASPSLNFEIGQAQRYFGLWLFISMLVPLTVLTQVFGESQDWENYAGMFDAVRSDGLQAEGVERIEIGFKSLSSILIFLSLTNAEVYAVISAISLIIKCAAVNKLSGSRAAFVFGMAFYVVCVAPLHELTQLRAALAITFLFVSYSRVFSGGYIGAVLSAAAAACFHLSASLVFLPLTAVFLFKKGFFEATRLKVVLLGVSVFFVTASAIAIAILYFEDLLLVVSAYQELGFGDEVINPFSPSVLLNVIFLIAGFFLWSDITPNMRCVLAFQAIGTAFFFATLEFQVVAFRVFELFQAFVVFFVVDGVMSRHRRVRGFTYAYAFVALAAYSYIYFFSGNFFL